MSRPNILASVLAALLGIVSTTALGHGGGSHGSAGKPYTPAATPEIANAVPIVAPAKVMVLSPDQDRDRDGSYSERSEERGRRELAERQRQIAKETNRLVEGGVALYAEQQRLAVSGGRPDALARVSRELTEVNVKIERLRSEASSGGT